MRLLVYLPLLIPVLAALAARPLAARLEPRDATWLLAVADEDASREPAVAVRLAERAVALSGRQDAAALDALGAAYAAAGDFGRAVDAAQAALALVPPNAAAIAERRDLYKLQRPYRIPAR